MLTLEGALAELERHAGGQFDPRAVYVFVGLVRRKVAQSAIPQDGSLLLAEVAIDGTVTEEAACRSAGAGLERPSWDATLSSPPKSSAARAAAND